MWWRQGRKRMAFSIKLNYDNLLTWSKYLVSSFLAIFIPYNSNIWQFRSKTIVVIDNNTTIAEFILDLWPRQQKNEVEVLITTGTPITCMDAWLLWNRSCHKNTTLINIPLKKGFFYVFHTFTFVAGDVIKSKWLFGWKFYNMTRCFKINTHLFYFMTYHQYF